MKTDQIAQVTNDVPLAETLCCAQRDRDTTADIVALLAAVDDRRLYKALGSSSMFVYCTDVLHFSEGAAYTRIAAARTSRKFPIVLGRLASAEINLSTLDVLVARTIRPYWSRDKFEGPDDVGNASTSVRRENAGSAVHRFAT